MLSTRRTQNEIYCYTCFRKFDSKEALHLHITIDHEDHEKRQKMSDLHSDFYFYSHRKGISIPKNKYISAFYNLLFKPEEK